MRGSDRCCLGPTLMRKRSKGEREVEEREDVLGGRRQGGTMGM